MVQGLRLCTPNAVDLGLIPGQATRSHMPQLKILCAATKTQHSQINFSKKEMNRQATDKGKISALPIFEKRLVSGIYIKRTYKTH